MKNKKSNSIFCPYCNREYHPSEIFIPDNFLGKVTTVMRMSDGSIEAIFGKDMDLKESYICDKCNTEFDIQAKVSFKTFSKKNSKFKEEYVTRLNNKLIMLED